MAEPVITLKNVTIRYKDIFSPVLEDITLNVPGQQVVMLIGPNGSGKSSLIKAILGLIPHQGEIKVQGRDINQCPHAIGYVPQTHSIDLSFPMTVSEFLHYSHVNCPDYLNRQSHINHTLDLINAGSLRDKTINTLSGGQLQRVLLARAIVHQPRVLILDEPETGIDVGGEQTLYDLLVKLNQEHGISVLVATHELDTVYHYADQVICLNRALICQGKPEKVLTLDTLHQLYGRHVRNFYDIHQHES